MIIKGTIERTYFSNERWASFVIRSDDLRGGETRAAGNMPCVIMKGMTMELIGDFIEHPKYGRQFSVKKARNVSNDSSKLFAVKEFLSNAKIKGIGPKTAQRIIDKYGEDAMDVIQNHTMDLCCLPGITPKKVDMILESLPSVLSCFPLYVYLNGRVSMNACGKLCQHYESADKAISAIQENPYVLIYDVDGFGFIRADRIALAAGFSECSAVRINAAVTYTLTQMSHTYGHCFSDADSIQQEVMDLILPLPVKTKKERAEAFVALNDWDEKKEAFLETKSNQQEWIDYAEKYQALTDLIFDGIVKEDQTGHVVIDENGTDIYEKSLYCSEMLSAIWLAQMVKKKPAKVFKNKTVTDRIEQAERVFGYSLAEAQKKAIRVSTANRISVITGGPGRGKTTILKVILNIWNDPHNVILCAPTGRAAQRMKEATDYQAYTMHQVIQKAIAARKHHDGEDDGKEVHHDFNEPEFLITNKTLVICDEASMIDMKLAAAFLDQVKDATVIFVGDADQIAPVGPGLFFRDLILSRCVPTVFLNEGFRSHGSIAQNADAINSGAPVSNFILDDSFHFISCQPEEIEDEVCIIYKKLLQKYNRDEIGVLTPIRKRGNACIDALTRRIRREINPEQYGETTVDHGAFRIRDRVMVTRNKSNYPTQKGKYHGTGICNGDTGTIVDIENEYDFEEGDYNKTITIMLDDGRIIEAEEWQFKLAGEEPALFEHADAMTFHKSQGSEYKAVIMVMNQEHAFFLKRNLFYTAVTRARNELYIVGQKKAAGLAIHSIDDTVRNTKFAERLQKERVEPTTLSEKEYSDYRRRIRLRFDDD